MRDARIRANRRNVLKLLLAIRCGKSWPEAAPLITLQLESICNACGKRRR